MTFIKPHQQVGILGKTIAILAAALVCGTFYLVVLYNNIVNLEHNIAGAKSSTAKIEAQNADLKNKTLEILSGVNLRDFAAQKGLVEDRSPAYFEIQPQWSFASQH